MASILGVSALLSAGLGAGSSIAAANTQANAANNAAQLQYDLGEQSLGFEKQQFNQNQANLAPWLNAGSGALSELTSQTNTPGQGLLAPFSQQFKAPTIAEAEQYPGYQFQLQQGQNAIQNSAAARGGLVSGNAATALNNYSQGAAQSDYNNVYNEAMQQYLNSFNIYNSNQANAYNRLAGLAGTGQTAATTLGQLGNQAGNTVAGINSATGSQVGQNLNNAGAATASGYVGLGNALGGGISGLGQSLLLQSLLGNSAGTSGGSISYVSPYGNSAPGTINSGFYSGANQGPIVNTPYASPPPEDFFAGANQGPIINQPYSG